ncbi:Peptidase S8 subtilisin-related protein [Dioscorea alata]|uniref:Peptidase S8 subtilisin-related protein n=1 Tax=Dioscorea alata TaxID=55571 RepID=A0ACB7VMG6_DIOAL|nr:Peptidase S8 subtilisin-related protein [Dioscorea alata]
MGEKPSLETSAQSLHFNLLNHVLDGITARESIVHSYGRSFNAFAAKLTENEKQRLEDMEGIVSVFPSKTLHLHTTRSWDFLGFTETMEQGKTLKSDVIVGIIDTGIWPESKSFSDEGFGPPPKKWKGSCNKNFTCNNKIIGAKYYAREGTSVDEPSPRDTEGHGSHTASTVAGATVRNVSFYGIAKGKARGALPGARLAIYKVCWPNQGCSDEDLLAAFDDAIADGVDIISISIGGVNVREYFSDSIAIGSFHAMKKGIVTSASAGNGGPSRETLSNMAPWMISVAASSIDRKIIGKVVVGNNKSFVGVSVNPFPTTKVLPFISPPSCYIDYKPAKGNIVLCSDDDSGEAASSIHAAGLVSIDSSSYIDFGRQYPLPALDVIPEVGLQLNKYINSTSRNPVAKILKSEEIFDPKAPVIISFSSRGPSTITPDILKPDISAPGVDIIAAWSPKAKLTFIESDKRSVNYNIISGTSMACPHVAGVAAYIKSFHPSWSPAAILSALVTTATPMNPLYHPDGELDHGAGQLNPVNAAKPGLIYDASVADYIEMLCNMGYNTTKLRIITGDKSTCNSSKIKNGNVRDLNYPSLALKAKEGIPVHASFPRTVTNVGLANSVYKAKIIIISNSKLNVTVKPQVLKFEALNQTLEFVVTVSGPAMKVDSVASASLVWFDGKHSVRSPIVVFV